MTNSWLSLDLVLTKSWLDHIKMVSALTASNVTSEIHSKTETMWTIFTEGPELYFTYIKPNYAIDIIYVNDTPLH